MRLNFELKLKQFCFKCLTQFLRSTRCVDDQTSCLYMCYTRIHYANKYEKCNHYNTSWKLWSHVTNSLWYENCQESFCSSLETWAAAAHNIRIARLASITLTRDMMNKQANEKVCFIWFLHICARASISSNCSRRCRICPKSIAVRIMCLRVSVRMLFQRLRIAAAHLIE